MRLGRRLTVEALLRGSGVAIVIAFAGCADTQPLGVQSEWGPGVRFSEATRTFDWSPQAGRTKGPDRPVNPHADPIIRSAIVKALEGRGYAKGESGQSDFWIDYQIGKIQRGDPSADPNFTGFTEGVMALYVQEPGSQKLIWRGTVQMRIEDSDRPALLEKKLDRAVGALVTEIPAKKPAR